MTGQKHVTDDHVSSIVEQTIDLAHQIKSQDQVEMHRNDERYAPAMIYYKTATSHIQDDDTYGTK